MPKRSFKEYVKNPKLFWKDVWGRPRPSSAPSDADLAALVTTMATSRLEYEDLQWLKQAGEKVVPLLVTVLQDSKFLFRRYGEDVYSGSPLETALDLLEPFATPPAAMLESALKHEDERFRAKALYHLAQCGNDDAISALSDGLASPSEQSRTYALMGLEFLKRTGRGSELFRRTLFDATLPLLDDEHYNPAGAAPRVLLVLDRERALGVLLGASVFQGGNRNVSKVLQALKDAEVPVPAARLRALLMEIREKASSYPFDYAYADGLILLARTEGAAAADLFTDAQGWGNQKVKEAAAEAIGIAAGVRDAHTVVMRRFEQEGAASLSEPQLFYLTLNWLDAEVRNGGFSQYFFNSSGALAVHAVRAARAVGATELASIIQRAVALFGRSGVAADRDTRMDQLSALALTDLSELDTLYYECPDDIRELLPLYVARHASEFRPPVPG